MTKKPTKDQLWFGRPTVSDRLYIAQGPSGLVEMLQRKKLDAELVRFLGEAPLADVVDHFIKLRAIDERPTITWATVVGFLGRLVDASPLDVPPEIALAFWGQVELALRAQGAN